MIGSFLLAAAAATTSAPRLPYPEPPPLDQIMTDGHYRPPRIDVSYEFDCRNLRVSLRYRQERFDLERAGSVAAADRVTLIRLEPSDVRLSRQELEQARAVFDALAFVYEIRPTCSNGTLSIDVKGMLRSDWANYVERDDLARPDPVTRTIQVGRGRFGIR